MNFRFPAFDKSEIMRLSWPLSKKAIILVAGGISFIATIVTGVRAFYHKDYFVQPFLIHEEKSYSGPLCQSMGDTDEEVERNAKYIQAHKDEADQEFLQRIKYRLAHGDNVDELVPVLNVWSSPVRFTDTCLFIAVEANYLASVSYLLDHGANPNGHDLNSLETPLIVAVACKYADMVELLVTRGASMRGVGDRTLLEASYNIEQFLGVYGVQSSTTRLGYSGASPIMKYLLQHGAAGDVKTISGERLLYRAIELGDGDISIIELLVEYGVNVNSTYYAPNTPLDVAIRKRNSSMGFINGDIITFLRAHDAKTYKELHAQH